MVKMLRIGQSAAKLLSTIIIVYVEGSTTKRKSVNRNICLRYSLTLIRNSKVLVPSGPTTTYFCRQTT